MIIYVLSALLALPSGGTEDPQIALGVEIFPQQYSEDARRRTEAGAIYEFLACVRRFSVQCIVETTMPSDPSMGYPAEDEEFLVEALSTRLNGISIIDVANDPNGYHYLLITEDVPLVRIVRKNQQPNSNVEYIECRITERDGIFRVHASLCGFVDQME